MTSSLSVSTGTRSTCAYVNDTRPQMPTNPLTLKQQFGPCSPISLLTAKPKTIVLHRLYRLRDPVNFTVLFMSVAQVFFFFFPLEDLRKCNKYDIRLGTRDFWRWSALPPFYNSQLATHFTSEALNNLTTILTTSCFNVVRTEHLWQTATDICLRVMRSTNMATSGEVYVRLCLQNKQNRTTPYVQHFPQQITIIFNTFTDKRISTTLHYTHPSTKQGH